MRALRFHAAGDLRIEEVADPPAPTRDEVLVAPIACGICGTDLHEYLAGPLRVSVRPDPLTGGCVPQILGHELSAEVLEVGPDVVSVSAGDRVSVMPLVSCGRCSACRAGRLQHCEMQAAIGLRHPWGGMAQRALVTESQLSKMPDGVTWEQGALIEPLAVAHAAVVAGGIGDGDRVLVCGAGPIGSLAALAAEAFGAEEVLVSEPDPGRAVRVRAWGFEAANPRADDLVALCRERHDGGMDVVLECSGRPDALLTALRSVRSGGHVVQVGVIAEEVPLNPLDLLLRGVSLTGSSGYRHDCWPALLALVEGGKLRADRVITGRVSLEDAVRAGFDELAKGGEQIKVLVDVAGRLAAS